jgi:Spy/CpxP family protein refolding chaperone
MDSARRPAGQRQATKTRFGFDHPNGDSPMTRSIRSILLLLLLAGTSAGTALAQDSAAAAPPAVQGHAPRDPQKQTAQLSRKLGLTPAQAAKIEPILQNRQQQLEQLRADASLSPHDRHARMRALTQDSASQLQAVLTASQRQQYRQLMQQTVQRRQQQKSPSTAPSSSE